jgi:hypothetical protein
VPCLWQQGIAVIAPFDLCRVTVFREMLGLQRRSVRWFGLQDNLAKHAFGKSSKFVQVRKGCVIVGGYDVLWRAAKRLFGTGTDCGRTEARVSFPTAHNSLWHMAHMAFNIFTVPEFVHISAQHYFAPRSQFEIHVLIPCAQYFLYQTVSILHALTEMFYLG